MIRKCQWRYKCNVKVDAISKTITSSEELPVIGRDDVLVHFSLSLPSHSEEEE
jgi:hypothetical protein